MDTDERMQRLRGLFAPLERGHTALVRRLESLFDSMPSVSALLDPESMLTLNQRRALDLVRDQPVMSGAWRDLQGRRYSIPATLMGKTREEGNFMAPYQTAQPQYPPYDAPPPSNEDMRRWERSRPVRPDLPPGEALDLYERRSALPFGLLAAGDWERMNQGLPMHRVPGGGVPRPYPWPGTLFPHPGEGPVFRTNPQGPVRNIAGTRRA